MNEISILYGFVAIAAMISLALFGVPIGVSLGTVGLVGLCLTAGPKMAFITLKTLPLSLSFSYSFVVVPMFVFMGLVASGSGLMTDLYDAFNKWFAKVKGSLILVTTGASAAFGAVSGSTLVNATVFTNIAFPEMLRLGYKPGIGAAAIAAAGTLAALIPPSLNVVIIGILTEMSIGRLLLAALVPGIVTALVYMIGTVVCVRLFPDWAPEPSGSYSWGEKFSSLRHIWPVACIFAIIVGGIYTGITAPSAAGGLGALAAVVILMIQGRMRKDIFWNSLTQTVNIMKTLFIIIVGGMIFGKFLALSGAIDSLAALIQQSGMGKYQFLAMVMGVFIVLGMFMDSMTMLIITTPLLYPLVSTLGINPIWYGIVLLKLMEISTLSPPVGLNLFAVLAAAGPDKLKVGELYKGIIPFLVFEGVIMVLLFLFPEIVTWLPDMMMR